MTARGVAAELLCSTQAVYTALGSMANVREAVQTRAASWVREQLDAAGGRESYLALGVRTLRLAQAEPFVFEMARQVMVGGIGTRPDAMLLAAMRRDVGFSDADDEMLARAHDLLTLLLLGLASTLVDGSAAELERATAQLRTGGEWISGYVAQHSNRAKG